MKAFRVAHRNNVGPYDDINLNRLQEKKANHVSEKMLYAHGVSSGHPPFFVYQWSCGMTTIKGIYEWFNGWIRDLNKAGFVLTEYDVSEDNFKLDLDSEQIAFDVSKSTKVAVYSLWSDGPELKGDDFDDLPYLPATNC